VHIGGRGPTEITDEIAAETLRQCLDGPLNQDRRLTYCVVEDSDEGEPKISLLRWDGPHRPYEVIAHVD
jgi:hypothetical protein